MPDTLPMFDVSDEAPPRSDADSPIAAARPCAPEPAQANRSSVGGSHALPPVIDVETAGRLLGLGRSAAYQLVKDGMWPTPVLRLGRRWRVLTAPLLALLEIDGPQSSAVDGTLQPSPTAPAIFRHDQGDQR